MSKYLYVMFPRDWLTSLTNIHKCFWSVQTQTNYIFQRLMKKGTASNNPTSLAKYGHIKLND